MNYKYWDDSAFGSKVDIIAPGVGIRGPTNGDNTNYIRNSGCSAASALTAATMAIYVGYEGITDNTGEVYKRLEVNQLEGAIDGVPPWTPNKFLNIGYGNAARGNHPYAGVKERITAKRAENVMRVGESEL